MPYASKKSPKRCPACDSPMIEYRELFGDKVCEGVASYECPGCNKEYDCDFDADEEEV